MSESTERASRKARIENSALAVIGAHHHRAQGRRGASEWGIARMVLAQAIESYNAWEAGVRAATPVSDWRDLDSPAICALCGHQELQHRVDGGRCEAMHHTARSAVRCGCSGYDGPTDWDSGYSPESDDGTGWSSGVGVTHYDDGTRRTRCTECGHYDGWHTGGCLLA